MGHDNADPMVGRILDSRYRIESRVGVGRSSVIYRARHVLLERLVALKFIRPELRQELHLRAFLLREGRAANRLSDPRVPDVLDIEETPDGELYLVMEYVVGVPLFRELATAPLEPHRGVAILREVCGVLQHAHERGVVHGFLSSAKVLLAGQAATARDFHLIGFLGFELTDKDVQERAAQPRTQIRTRTRATPDPLAVATDIRGLGRLMFEMFTAHEPLDVPSKQGFIGHLPVATVASKLEEAGIAAGLRELIERSLGTRGVPPLTVAEVSEELEDLAAAQLVAAAPLPKPQAHFGDYVLLKQLDGGGMAECFRGQHATSHETVFLKRVVETSVDAAALQRELEVYARLQYVDSPHVLQIRESFRYGEYVVLVTDFAEGGDLRSHVDARSKAGLPLREALGIARQVARGLAVLHEANIVHRDLKPENVLCSGETWKLADFGIAKNRDRAAPGRTFQHAGTYGYAAPEQFEGTPAEPSADVFSFGKVMTFLITGATDVDKIRLEVDSWRSLVRKCTKAEPADRPTIGAVIEVLADM